MNNSMAKFHILSQYNPLLINSVITAMTHQEQMYNTNTSQLKL